ncbi:MAG: PQQ-dependent dehydrogenase, methanol/ethanol family [Rhodobiaceae bacterium]|mgnify:FL=1|nr:PQQ-dependent dehydrogenase, methanol/ethanol family [Rhodobiaceae bacterium]|tara:strand:+ start:4006 stop:6228 length:2223 start_codon:yes stop_codon:yes gene_type:complete
MAHPSLNRKSAIIINAILLFSLALIIIYKLILISEVKITKEIPIENETEVIKKEKIGNINTERIINANNEPQNWLSHGRDYHEQRYSPLNQINLETINKLELEWSLDMGTKRGLEATPIIDNGIMFVSSTWSVVHAVDAKTGKELWVYDPDVPRSWARKVCCDVVNRGVAVWEGQVYFGTIDGRLISLDAKTGKNIWEINTLIDSDKDYTITGAPRVANGKVYIGNGGADMGGVRGYVSAYNTKNGNLEWRFFTVPGDPSLPFEHPELEMASKTWTGQWWTMGGGGTVWNAIVFDPEFNQLYIGTGNGSPWNQQIRSPEGGDNLFLSSIVALNADTGKMNWYYQTTPEERWDYTATQDIILADLNVDGEDRKVLMQAPKNGFFYVLDRKTGELLRANNYVKTNWATHVDLKTGRPVLNPNKDYYEKAIWILPGTYGGHGWQAMSYDPKQKLVFIPTMEIAAVHRVKKTFEETGLYKMLPETVNTGTEFNLFDTVPDMSDGDNIPPITGELIAFDPLTGETRWSVKHKQFWNGGPLTTAGGLVFQGNASGFLEAYNAKNGKLVWSKNVYTGIMAPPVTYMIDEEQYISILAGDGGASNFLGDNFGIWEGQLASIKYGNYGKLLTFKLNGKSKIEALEEKDLSIPEQPIINASLEDIKAGQDIYANYCAICHGSGVHGKTISDLRYMSKETHEYFNEIVLNGMLEENGMKGFSDILNEKNAFEVYSYIVDVATKERSLQQRN